MAAASGAAWTDILVEIFDRDATVESLLVPAVAEPLLVWVVSGEAVVQERELGGEWITNEVRAGDFFLTTSSTPYELQWEAETAEPFQVLHAYLSLRLFEKAAAKTEVTSGLRLREVSGASDSTISALLGVLKGELANRSEPSEMFVSGIARALAVHLVRTYAVAERVPHVPAGLPAFKLRRVQRRMVEQLAEPFDLEALAELAEMSAPHFSRVFKRATGLSPSQFFIRERMQEACRLLRETSQSIIDISLDVGYGSHSHFSQIFRREVGVSPSAYRTRLGL